MKLYDEKELKEVISYNKRTSKKLGWKPSWLGQEGFDQELVRKIQELQQQYDLEPDGKVGPTTYRRLLIDKHEVESKELEKTCDYLVLSGQKIRITWPVVSFDEDPGWGFPEKNMKVYSLDKPRKIHMIVVHWDVTNSAKQTHRVLKNNGISSHFCIDNDGVIYQYMDPKDRAYHAPPVNGRSIGIDLSNAFYTSKQKEYVKSGFGARPIVSDCFVNGKKLPKYLDFYPIQLIAFEKLVKVLSDFYPIPLETPMKHVNELTNNQKKNNDYFISKNPELGKYEVCLRELHSTKFCGLVGHYNVDKKKRKIDPGEFPFISIIKNINMEK